MSSSMSQASIPAFEIGLNALSAVLEKAETFAKTKKIDPTVLVSWRLAPDMFALARQVQIVADQAKNGCARLAGVDAPASRTTRRPLGSSRAGSRRPWHI
jgi:hypothetical protein